MSVNLVGFDPKTRVFQEDELRGSTLSPIKKYGAFKGFFIRHFGGGVKINVQPQGTDTIKTYTVSKKDFAVLQGIVNSNFKIPNAGKKDRKLSENDWKLVTDREISQKFILKSAPQVKKLVDRNPGQKFGALSRKDISGKLTIDQLVAVLKYLVLTDQIHAFAAVEGSEFLVFDTAHDLEEISTKPPKDGFQAGHYPNGVQTKEVIRDKRDGEPLYKN